MAENTTFVRIVGEPFLSRAKVYREELRAWSDAWGAFAKERGADGIGLGGRSLSFKNNDPPVGWTRPIGQSRMSHPKKGHADVEALAQLRERCPRPDARFVFGAEVPDNLSWEAPDGSHGGSGIGSLGMVLNGPWVGWAGETYLGWMPDPEAAVREFTASYPDRRIVGAAASWMMPDRLIRISEAEYEFVMAQHKVELERAAASERGEAA